MNRIVNTLGKLNWGNRAYAVSVVLAMTVITSPGQTFTTLHSFDGTDGENPFAALVQATNGDLYGTTNGGGALGACTLLDGCGTVFKITPGGTLTTLYSFCSQSGCPDGGNPNGLVQATNGDLYGTTSYGGANCAPSGCGTVFKITLSGTLTTLYSFCTQSGCTDGYYPQARLVQASNGDLYGTTPVGGIQSSACIYGSCGTVFKITPEGTLTTLYSFCTQSGCLDGAYPQAGLVQVTNGDFYGTTPIGGIQNSACIYGSCGTVFKITASGTLNTLYSFCAQGGCPDGQYPGAALVQATNGDLYGSTEAGGANAIGTAGTVFKVTPSGTLTTPYSFCSQSGCLDGAYPAGALVEARGCSEVEQILRFA
jgi:uncharacterized repeat protein (TIGR03803 family)